MTIPEAWLILLITLALWLTRARGSIAHHPALPTVRLPRGRLSWLAQVGCDAPAAVS